MCIRKSMVEIMTNCFMAKTYLLNVLPILMVFQFLMSSFVDVQGHNAFFINTVKNSRHGISITTYVRMWLK